VLRNTETSRTCICDLPQWCLDRERLKEIAEWVAENCKSKVDIIGHMLIIFYDKTEALNYMMRWNDVE
jgi:hypothetical protein